MSLPEISQPLPTWGRLLGVDFGDVRVGLAVCDADRIMASPLETITRGNREQDSKKFLQVVRSEGIVGIVVGLPLHMSGEMSPKAEQAVQYGKWVAELTGLPVAYHDERCTSAAAEEVLWAAGLTHQQRKKRRDQLAAQLILQAWIESQHSRS
jgi:putative Holliday junction resolvase